MTDLTLLSLCTYMLWFASDDEMCPTACRRVCLHQQGTHGYSRMSNVALFVNATVAIRNNRHDQWLGYLNTLWHVPTRWYCRERVPICTDREKGLIPC